MKLEEAIESLAKVIGERPYDALVERHAKNLIVSMNQLEDAKAILSSSIGLNKEIYEEEFPDPEEEIK